MRAIRTLLEGKIQMSVEGREEVEVACRKLVREEASAWRGRQEMPLFLILGAECHTGVFFLAPPKKLGQFPT